MRLIGWLFALTLLVIAGIHLFFYWSVGTFDPCQAAVLRIIQKQKQAGQQLPAVVGTVFARPLEDALRSEGVMTCYRSALRGEAPEIELQILKQNP